MNCIFKMVQMTVLVRVDAVLIVIFFCRSQGKITVVKRALIYVIIRPQDNSGGKNMVFLSSIYMCISIGIYVVCDVYTISI